MKHSTELFRRTSHFIDASASGFLQLLVAAAKPSTLNRILNCPTYPAPAGTRGLTVAVEELWEAMRRPDIHLPTFFARLYASVTSLQDRKQAGQFFTAREVAEWSLKRARPKQHDIICDAGAGTAVFANAIVRSRIGVQSYVGVENDPILALCAAHVLDSINAPKEFRIWYANFLTLDATAFRRQGMMPPSFIVANPPFVRSHRLSGRDQIRTALKSSFGIMLSSFSGSIGYFLTRAAELAESASSAERRKKLKPRLLFLLPREAKGAAHVQRLRNDLQTMYGWDCREYQIPNSQTGIERHPSNALALLFVFERKNSSQLTPAHGVNHFRCVQDVLEIKRGISTGCNEFFLLTEEDARRRKINKKWLRRVLPTRIHIPRNHFSLEDWESLRDSGLRCWLLALPNRELDQFEIPVQEYLKEGLRRGLHATPTAKRLKSWFSLPLPSEAPDTFLTYFFRGIPRFIRNDAQVFHLTNILGGRFVSRDLDQTRKELIIDSLNKQAVAWMESEAGREYRDGLRKIEPGEMSRLPIDVALFELACNEGNAARAASALLFEV